MLLVHAPITPRTSYACELLFRHILAVPYRLDDDPLAAAGHDGPVLCYDRPAPPGTLQIPAMGLLRQRGVAPQEPAPFAWEDTLALFPAEGDLPFDLLAAAFYLASRYEEYLVSERDAHGRFPPHRSVLAPALRQPVVADYARHLRARLAAQHPRFPWPEPQATALSTIDVDVAYAYRGRPPARALLAAGRAVLDRQRGGLRERLAVLRGRWPDPFDTFDWLEERHRASGVPSRYFFLVSDGGPMDRNLPPNHPLMRALIARLAREAAVGLHPSYRTRDEPARLAREAGRLARLAGGPVRHSRQHFLRFELPQTYRNLIASGVRHEYSMGYAAEPGFRAGMAHPFPFYDLERDEAAPLTIHPLAYMDGTLNEHLGMAPAGAIAVIDELAANVRRSGGQFVSLWHNQTVTDRGRWRGWRAVFEHSLAAAGGKAPAGRGEGA
jgi:hypothetical protein